MADDMAEALLALGGNIGDVRATLDRAVAALCDGDDGAAHSPARRTTARRPGASKDQPPFVNLAIAVETGLPPHALLARAQAVERALGRERAKERRWGPRPIDIDLLAYDDIVLNDARSDAAAPPAVRARLRAGAACGDRAGAGDRAASASRRAGAGGRAAASKSCRTAAGNARRCGSARRCAAVHGT